ncbi:hypothetical protein NKG94_50290 [Micromonospora sp. M12]
MLAAIVTHDLLVVLPVSTVVRLLAGRQGLRARTYDGRELAAYTCRRLKEIGWPSWRNLEAMTVVLPTLRKRP